MVEGGVCIFLLSCVGGRGVEECDERGGGCSGRRRGGLRRKCVGERSGRVVGQVRCGRNDEGFCGW